MICLLQKVNSATQLSQCLKMTREQGARGAETWHYDVFVTLNPDIVLGQNTRLVPLLAAIIF